ncbi:MAG: CvpA family protein [Clostridia bacterium]|nr:CvpA family protein [Clostridia bacterium]
MNFLQIVNIVYFAIIGLILFVEIIVGLVRGTGKSLVRLVFLAISAFVAVILTSVVMGRFGGDIYNMLYDNLGLGSLTESLSELFAASPTLAEYLPAVVISALSPIAFTLVFIVLALITMIFGAIINSSFSKGEYGENKKSVDNRVIGMVLSLLCGVIISGCLMMPATGYIVNAGKVYSKLEEQEVIAPTSEQGNSIAEVLKNAKELPIVSVTDTATSFIFDATSQYTLSDGSKSSVAADAESISNVAPAVVNLGTMDFSDTKNIDVTPLRDILKGIENNETIRAIIAEVLSYASGKWLNEQEFMGLNLKKQLPEDIKDDLDPALEKLNETTKATVIDDLNMFIDEIEALSGAYKSVSEFTENDFSDLSKINVEPMNEVVSVIENTVIARKIVANLLASAGQKWIEGKPFMGVDIEAQLPDDLKGVLNPAYDMLSSTDNDNVIDKLHSLTALLADVKAIMGEINVFTAQDFGEGHLQDVDATPLNHVADDIENASSALTRPIVTEIIKRAGEKWLLWNEFLGLNLKQQLPLEYRETLDPALVILADTTEETVVDDINNLADAVSSLVNTYKFARQIASGDTDINTSSATLSAAFATVSANNVELVSGIVDQAVKEMVDDDATSVAVSGVMKKVLEKIAEANVPGSETFTELSEKYADAVTEIVGYVNGGNMQATADAVINVVLENAEVGEVLRDYTSAYESVPVATTPEQKLEIANAIANYEEANPTADADTINAIKAFFAIL